MLSAEKFKRRIEHGDYFPHFSTSLFSIPATSAARAAVCWEEVGAKDAIDLDALNHTITDAEYTFYGLLTLGHLPVA